MSILEYFKRTSTSGIQPNGSLSAIVPSTAIVAANVEVQQLAEKRFSRNVVPTTTILQRTSGYWSMLSNMELLLLRKCFLESRGHGSTVRGFKKVYKKEILKKREAGDDDACVTKLDTKKKGGQLC